MEEAVGYDKFQAKLSRLASALGNVSPVSSDSLERCAKAIDMALPRAYVDLMTLIGPFEWMDEKLDGVYLISPERMVELTRMDRCGLREIGELPERKFAVFAFTDYTHFRIFECGQVDQFDVESLRIVTNIVTLEGFVDWAIAGIEGSRE